MASLRSVSAPLRLSVLILAFAGLPIARAQDERTPRLAPAPPQPRSISVATSRAEPVDIRLKIFGARRDVLTFLIRKPPEAGRVSEPQNDASDSAVVRYIPPADRSVKQASFSYAVKSTEGVSAPVEVTIAIMDEPAKLLAPPARTFPSALLGERKIETLEISNPGGEVSEGEVSVNEPFKIEGSAAYRIEPQGKAFVRLAFEPMAAGDFEEEVRFSSHPLTVTTLKARANAPLSIEPATLDLGFESLTGVRSGFFKIGNHTARTQSIAVRTSARLKIDGPIELAPGGEKIVTVATAADDVGAIEEPVKFEGMDAEASLEVKSTAVPALIRVAPKRLTLGTGTAGAALSGDLNISNSGGMPTTVRVATTEGLRLSVQELSLAPGETKAVSVFLGKTGRANLHETLTVSAEGESQTVEVRTPIAGDFPRAIAGKRTKSSAAEERASDTASVSRDAGTDARNTPRSADTRLIEVGNDFATIEWPASDSPKGYRAEIRQLASRNGELEVTWVLHPEFEAAVADGRVRGTLGALVPAQVHAVRILGGAGFGEVVAAKSFITKKPARLRIFTWPRALGAAAAGLIGFVLWRRWQQRGTGL